MKTRTDLTGAELKTLEACQTATDWSRACDAIKLTHGGGYPSDWYARVIQSGMANRIAARWGGDAELHFTVIPTEAVSVRYVVRPCDNLGSIEGLERDRTWVVVRKHDGQEQEVVEVHTRAAAYEYKRQCERENEEG